MAELIAAVPRALDRCAAIAVSGPYGSGKSTTLAALAADVNTAVVNMPRRTTEKAQWDYITTAVTGQPATGTARQMQNTTRDFLTAVPTLLIVDEAQFIGRSALLQLRWLWDHNFPRFAIVLSGSDLFAHLASEPSVSSRIDRRIELRHHSSARMLELITAHHPLFASADRALLADIDATYARGDWRAWSKLLLFIANDLGHTLEHDGPLTRQLAAQAVQAVTGMPAAFAPAGPTRTSRAGTRAPVGR